MAMRETETYLDLEADGEAQDGAALASFLTHLAETLAGAPVTKRYSFTVTIEEHDLGGGDERDE